MEIVTFKEVGPLEVIKERYWWSGRKAMPILMWTSMNTSYEAERRRWYVVLILKL